MQDKPKTEYGCFVGGRNITLQSGNGLEYVEALFDAVERGEFYTATIRAVASGKVERGAFLSKGAQEGEVHGVHLWFPSSDDESSQSGILLGRLANIPYPDLSR